MSLNHSPQVRVRFAPSPTGFLHIGGVRTALFNFLFAKHEQGVFLLRIEDTDRERSRPEFEEEILQALRWLGLNWDETFIRQSSRLEHYRRAAEELIQKGHAYRIEEDGRSAIKLKVTKETIRFDDLVHGPISFDAGLIEDFVIQKSDGYPTYHFACVIDDHEMNVTHVIRGDDHVSNTPKQLLIYRAFGWIPPKYAHLPLVFGQDKTPLSKRHGAVSLSAYQREGFLPEAILNYLALLGWSPGGNQEIFTPEQLILEFSLKKINKTNACFDLEKLKWVNAEHLRKLSGDEYVTRLSQFLIGHETVLNHPQFRSITLLYQDRIRTFQEFIDQSICFFSEPISFDSKAVEKYLTKKETFVHLELLEQELQAADFSNPQALEDLLRGTAQKLGLKAGDLIHPVRVAITGKQVSPGLFQVMSLLGKEIVLKRLRYVIIHAKL